MPLESGPGPLFQPMLLLSLIAMRRNAILPKRHSALENCVGKQANRSKSVNNGQGSDSLVQLQCIESTSENIA